MQNKTKKAHQRSKQKHKWNINSITNAASCLVVTIAITTMAKGDTMGCLIHWPALPLAQKWWLGRARNLISRVYWNSLCQTAPISDLNHYSLIICGTLCHSPIGDLTEMFKISATEVNQQICVVDVTTAEDDRRQPKLPTQTSRAWR